MKIKANNANSPIWKDVYSHSKLPQQLEPLNEIATNLWWVWNHEGAKLFGKIDKQLWKSTEGNPVQLLQSLSHKRMCQSTQAPIFLKFLYVSFCMI